MTDIVPHNKPPIVVLREKLEARKEELGKALVDISPDHFIRTVITAATLEPNLQACSWNSLWMACLRACRDQLLPDGREGAIVAFKDRATWIPMYMGLLKRFRQSGQCRWITADVVREGEVFEHWVDQFGEHFKHVPGTSDSVAPIERVYAAALTRDWAFYCAVMSMAEINKVKAMSKAAREDSPWRQWPDEMMKKTALRRLSKLLPAGRDFFEGEDEPPLPPSPQLAVDNEPRLPGAASALEQFAGTTNLPPGAGEGTDGGETLQFSAAPTDHFEIAYQRGRIAKETGAERRAVPGEYREETATQELEAWRAGYDGLPYLNPETGETYHGQA